MGQSHPSTCIPFHLLQLVVGGEGRQTRQLVLHETERSILPLKKKKEKKRKKLWEIVGEGKKQASAWGISAGK